MKKTISVVYLLLVCLYIVFVDVLPLRAGAMLKVLPVLLLTYWVCIQLQGHWRTGILLALIFSALGDAFLALEAIDANMFLVGLGSFFVAQLLYATVFWSYRSEDSGRARLAVLGFALMALAGFVIVPFAGELSAPVMVYVLAIGAMLMGAAVCDRPVNLLFAGALLFALSDSLIAVNKFIVTVPFAGVVIMALYYGAQFLLVQGALAKAR